MESIKPTMSGCMGKDKPKIAILMAVYEPRLDWLRDQLLSLNAQTYSNLILHVRDDCSITVPFEKIRTLVEECVTKFPFTISRNEKNLGSNRTFEKLTKESEEDLFAYCDQDDVWLPEKLEILQSEMNKTGALLVCSDMYVIDAKKRIVANSITEVRKRHQFSTNHKPFEELLTRNFVVGCTMLIKSKQAKSSIPFLDSMVHDHWLALCASFSGKVISINKPLIQYRIHDSNQTGVLVGVFDKQTYIKKRIISFCDRMQEIQKRFPKDLRIDKVLRWSEARQKYVEQIWGTAYCLWKMRKVNYKTTMFELLTLKLPNPIFCIALRFAKHSG